MDPFEARLQKMLSLINLEGLRHRASTLRAGTPCKVPDRELFGSSIYHLDIELSDGVRWLWRVRFPNSSIPPAVADRSLLSEAATMGYLASTAVSIPRVHDVALASDANSIGVSCIIMNKLSGHVLLWGKLDAAGRQKIMEQLADIDIELSKQPFPALGCLKASGQVGSIVSETEIDMDTTGRLTLIGPFVDTLKYRASVFTHFRDIIANGEVYLDTQNMLDAYLVFQCLVEHFSTIAEAEHQNSIGPGFYLKHVEDKGDHILIGDELNITRIIDWEGAQTTSPLNSFSSPLFLVDVPRCFLGENALCEDEILFASVLGSRGGDDLAFCVRNGRITHRVMSCLAEEISWPANSRPVFFGLRKCLGHTQSDNMDADWDALVLRRLLATYRLKGQTKNSDYQPAPAQ